MKDLLFKILSKLFPCEDIYVNWYQDNTLIDTFDLLKIYKKEKSNGTRII